MLENEVVLEDQKEADPLTGIINLDHLDLVEDDQKGEFGASVTNPNKDDDRRLFQDRRGLFT